MENALAIMKLPVNPKDERLIAVKAGIIGNVFSVTARTDSSKLRGAVTDRVGELLERIRAEQDETVQ